MANLISVKPIKGKLSCANESQINNTNSKFNSTTDHYPNNNININQTHTNNQLTSTKSCESPKPRTTGWLQYKGIIFTLITSIAVSNAVLLVKILENRGFHAYGISCYRYFGVTSSIIPVIFYVECRSRSTSIWDVGRQNTSIFECLWPLHINGNWKTCLILLFNGLLASTSWILRSYALNFLTIGDTSVITYTSPVLVTVMGHFLLGETCGIVPTIIAFTTLGGLITVTRPPFLTGGDTFDFDTLIGTCLATGALFCSSLNSILTRKFRKVHWALTTFIFGLVGVVETILLSFTSGHFAIPRGLYDSLLFSAFALISFVGVFAVIVALNCETAGTVTLFRSCDVIFGFILQFIFLGVVPDIYSTIGGSVVLGGVLLIAYRKFLGSLPEENPTRQRLSWLLR